MSISLGEKRIFRIRDYKTKDIVLDLDLLDRSYIVMGGDMQKHFTHGVIKVSGKKGLAIGRRINIIFRNFAVVADNVMGCFRSPPTRNGVLLILLRSHVFVGPLWSEYVLLDI